MSGIPSSLPKWGQRAVAGVFTRSAPLALAGLAAVGVAVLDDYGVGADEQILRHIGHATVNYLLGTAETLLPSILPPLRFYGVVFEVPLVFVEWLLGLTDSRAIYLSRHLLTHLFFLTGGYCCARLVYHLFHSRRLALGGPAAVRAPSPALRSLLCRHQGHPLRSPVHARPGPDSPGLAAGRVSGRSHCAG